MYFKIEKSGCSEQKGLVQVRYDLFLDEGDYNYNEHYVQVAVLPASGYPGNVDERGIPTDLVDFEKWINSLEKIWQNNPFCCHFCQFEPDVTDEEILYIGELALAMQYENWSVHKNLHRPINQPVKFSLNDKKRKKCSSRIAKIKATDFSKPKVQSKIPYRVK
jgi:hypothetical protein